MHGKEAIRMIFGTSQMRSAHELLEHRRSDASTHRLLRQRPRRAPTLRHALASALRRVADAVEPGVAHRHHPHLPS